VIDWWLCSEAPEPGDWLSRSERAHLQGLTVPKRRADWLLGRWTCKQLVAAWLLGRGYESPPPSAISIDAGGAGAPRLTLPADLPRARISVSHSRGTALCALSEFDPVGVDIEWVEPRDRSFLEDFFTPAEIAHIDAATDPDEQTTATWSAKESVLKAARTGLRADTRSVACFPAPRDSSWATVSVVTGPATPPAEAWWRRCGGYVLTAALTPPADATHTGTPPGR
jgi:4'-phosphopantetheinyl transferase